MASDCTTEYTLYSSPFSLYSMMARHTIQLGPTTQDAKSPPKIDLVFINHRKNEALKQDYLLKVNPKGQVPSMTGASLKKSLNDSRSISLFLAENHYPAMLPPQHGAIIRGLLERLHAVPGPSFSNKNPTVEMKQHNPSPAEEILKRDGARGQSSIPAIVAQAHADLHAIFAEIVEHRKESEAFGNPAAWTFGDQVGPTVLDSHLLPFVLRCMEAGYESLIPEELRHWAVHKSQSPTWFKVMRGRPTQWHPSMGPVEDMQDMMVL
ncbi:hypothetical protein PFICI_11723 [Pestalotiopsis fici W106-1]|uniref:GST N-terminal domain-containing protein n=1 Tax=Pestalotiopsis fici (strain W106-1 / CGMCC3.15140) TaxID=1229662 RepID=W3WU19_PESFW|nr:uncharacterized protein PFICI_11723 [Pestalotiopsis fici W106-1]ETS76336.1 hypothetical protein PFICI_11723 [Pestalotiopsis fici W106-1]